MNPLAKLAVALADGNGRYAVLIGSGVSRAAGMPTGWEVVGDLITRYAIAEGEGAPSDPFAWYRARFADEPSYSQLLDRLAPTQAERQAVLEAYWLPTDEDRERGLKIPSIAHRAIATLAQRGAVRIILTTNFDPLTEQALETAGVPFRVISSGDDAEGAPPYVHGGVYVVKISGDYRDTRIANTLAELSVLDPRLAAYLERIIDDFGLIVCGWSGEWDIALVETILAAPNRRYTMWWASRGKPRTKAAEIITKRDAEVIGIADADTFFGELTARVEALIDLRAPRLEDTEQASALVKHLLPRADGLIRLRELVIREADRVKEVIYSFPVESYPSGVEFKASFERIEAAVAVLASMLATIAFYGDHILYGTIVADAVRRFVPSMPGTGNPLLLNLRERWAAQVLANAVSVGAYFGNKPAFFASAYGGLFWHNGRTNYFASMIANDWWDRAVDKCLSGQEYYCGWTYRLRELARNLIPILALRADDFDRAFFRMDYVRSVLIRRLTDGAILAFGEGVRRSEIRDEVERERQEAGTEWPPFRTGIMSHADWTKYSSESVYDASVGD
ncbi:MAG: hypothetical protein JO036_08610 [Candidatus Eremiobacteraeota bacterium]|nr:hypothetical protein [Candidatus Eremiobacteraeota bacterium]